MVCEESFYINFEKDIDNCCISIKIGCLNIYYIFYLFF